MQAIYYFIYGLRQGGQLAARGRHVTRLSVFSGPSKHSEKYSNLKFSPIVTVNISPEVNLNQDFHAFPLEGMALR